jgi:predicted DNA repair protein MutK
VAGGSLLTLFDDIASLLDDVAAMTKVAAKKTAGILGDDLALNAEQVAGVRADRELPVVWAVAKGSLVNKVILVPIALGLSAAAPWLVVPLLMIGGAWLCYEGAEKLAHRFLHSAAERAAEHAELVRTLEDPAADVVAHERAKIRGAIRTDFVLSAEIVAITLAAAADATFGVRAAVVAAVAFGMTVGVYGFVAGIVRLDDAGLHLMRATGTGAGLRRSVGRGLVATSPIVMRVLTVVGTAAMFLVGGGILVHGFPPLHHALGGLVPAGGGLVASVLPTILEGLVGVVAGAILVALAHVAKRLRPAKST